MRVHHLDCCTMCPVGKRCINGEGPRFARARLVGHCLLVETDSHGLVLVDTGIGTQDVQDPRRLGAGFGTVMGVDATQTQMPALSQIQALGFRREDVRHLVLTHLDFDHAGGLPDFPQATVHVHAREKEAALGRASVMERVRYRPTHFEHGPRWQTYDGLGEPWMGLPAVRQLEGMPPEILAVPIPGHSRGHAAIAVDTGKGWLVHAGDAYFHRSEREAGDTRAMPWALRRIERFIAIDYPAVRANHRLLAELGKKEGVTVFGAHDAVEYDRLRGLTLK